MLTMTLSFSQSEIQNAIDEILTNKIVTNPQLREAALTEICKDEKSKLFDCFSKVDPNNAEYRSYVLKALTNTHRATGPIIVSFLKKYPNYPFNDKEWGELFKDIHYYPSNAVDMLAHKLYRSEQERKSYFDNYVIAYKMVGTFTAPNGTMRHVIEPAYAIKYFTKADYLPEEKQLFYEKILEYKKEKWAMAYLISFPNEPLEVKQELFKIVIKETTSLIGLIQKYTFTEEERQVAIQTIESRPEQLVMRKDKLGKLFKDEEEKAEFFERNRTNMINVHMCKTLNDLVEVIGDLTQQDVDHITKRILKTKTWSTQFVNQFIDMAIKGKIHLPKEKIDELNANSIMKSLL